MVAAVYKATHKADLENNAGPGGPATGCLDTNSPFQNEYFNSMPGSERSNGAQERKDDKWRNMDSRSEPASFSSIQVRADDPESDKPLRTEPIITLPEVLALPHQDSVDSPERLARKDYIVFP